MAIAQLADRPPYVEFKIMTEEDREQSIATGSYKTRDVDFVSIIPSGDRHLRVERKVDEWLAQQTEKVRQGQANPQHLDYFRSAYKVWKETQDTPLSGTPIKTWPPLSPAQVTNLLSANIRTVEDLAAVTENGIASIGMGGRALKEKAQAWLHAADGPGKVSEENAALKVKLKELATQFEAVSVANKEMMDELGLTEAVKPRRRPPKQDDDIELRMG